MRFRRLFWRNAWLYSMTFASNNLRFIVIIFIFGLLHGRTPDVEPFQNSIGLIRTGTLHLVRRYAVLLKLWAWHDGRLVIWDWLLNGPHSERMLLWGFLDFLILLRYELIFIDIAFERILFFQFLLNVILVWFFNPFGNFLVLGHFLLSFLCNILIFTRVLNSRVLCLAWHCLAWFDLGWLSACQDGWSFRNFVSFNWTC